MYVTGGEHVTRRELRSWTRIEDAWDADYTTAVAAQLVADGDVALPDSSNLPMLRDAVAATRAAGRTTYDRFADAVAWMFSDADWPLWGLDLPEDRPERRIEMINFDSEHDGPLWDERGRIASYPQLRLLSLRSNRLAGDLAIDLSALPRLEYLSLSENALTRVPSEVRTCRSLIHLNLRDNRLASIDPAELPSTLRWLDVGQNRLPEEAVRRLRAALPDCHIESYAQR